MVNKFYPTDQKANIEYPTIDCFYTVDHEGNVIFDAFYLMVKEGLSLKLDDSVKEEDIVAANEVFKLRNINNNEKE